MSRKWGLIAFICVTGLALAAGPGMAAKVIKVGVILPLKGHMARFGAIEKNSMEMALKIINATGLKNKGGAKLKLLYRDTEGRADKASSAVEQLITQDKVVMIGGGYSSSVTFVAAGRANRYGVPFLINTAAADKITEQGWKWIFRMNPAASEYFLGVLGLFKKVIKPKTVVIMHEQTTFGQSQAKKMKKLLPKAGYKVLAVFPYDSRAADFRPILMKIKMIKPDVVYMISYLMDAGLIMKQSREIRLNVKAFIGGAAGFTLPEFPKMAGKAHNLVFTATLWSESLPFYSLWAGKKYTAKWYAAEYLKRYKNKTDYHGAEAFAAVFVIADVLNRAKSLKPADIRGALLTTDLMTVFCPVKFIHYGRKRQQVKGTSYVMQWIGGNIETVWPPGVATKKYVYPVNYLKAWGLK
ncbi:MAG: ABC transporter substrate-binding protein [Proteobacteria bacterium]|nr:ABC transporter substrate-binding protein [Pseudomonadota bacterium]